MKVPDYVAALDAWRSAIGVEHVVLHTMPPQATFDQPQATSLAILRPGSREDVQSCMRIAHQHRVSIFPYSTGKNWGYGSPLLSDGALLDLSRLNRIVDYDDLLGYVTIEPGVTQRQLYAFLQGRGFWMDATGSSPDCSVIGNTMERGFGHTPMGDHAKHASHLEVVLPGGAVVETGLPMASGPQVDGLFTQSNFGVVTRMTVALMPAPEYFEACFFQGDRITAILDALRPLRMDGTVRSVVHIGNRQKAESAGVRGASPWNGSLGLYGTRAQVAAARKRVRGALGPVTSRMVFLNDRLLRWVQRLRLKALANVGPLYGLLQGRPVETHALVGVEQCGLLWLSPVIRNRGSDAQTVSYLSEVVLRKFGLDLLMSVAMVTERESVCVIAIAYDRTSARADRLALSCYAELKNLLHAQGYPSYRLATVGYGAASGLSLALKDALDPRHILAPGRYGL